MANSVELSPEAFAAAQRIASENGFATVAEYLDQLVYFDELDRGGVSAEHERLLLETLEKGKYSARDASYFERLREGIRARAKGKASA